MADSRIGKNKKNSFLHCDLWICVLNLDSKTTRKEDPIRWSSINVICEWPTRQRIFKVCFGLFSKVDAVKRLFEFLFFSFWGMFMFRRNVVRFWNTIMKIKVGQSFPLLCIMEIRQRFCRKNFVKSTWLQLKERRKILFGWHWIYRFPHSTLTVWK